MPNRFRSMVEKWLPWYDPDRERERDVRTERIRVKSIGARVHDEGARLFAERVERALAEYRAADQRK